MIIRHGDLRCGPRTWHYPRDRARMLVTAGGKRIVYLPSAAAAAIMGEWRYGATVSWETDDNTGKPHTIHFTPAVLGERGYSLKQDRHRHWIGIPTVAVGMAVPERAKEAEELDVLQSIVSVKLPFEFTVAVPRDESESERQLAL